MPVATTPTQTRREQQQQAELPLPDFTWSESFFQVPFLGRVEALMAQSGSLSPLVTRSILGPPKAGSSSPNVSFRKENINSKIGGVAGIAGGGVGNRSSPLLERKANLIYNGKTGGNISTPQPQPQQREQHPQMLNKSSPKPSPKITSAPPSPSSFNILKVRVGSNDDKRSPFQQQYDQNDDNNEEDEDEDPPTPTWTWSELSQIVPIIPSPTASMGSRSTSPTKSKSKSPTTTTTSISKSSTTTATSNINVTKKPSTTTPTTIRQRQSQQTPSTKSQTAKDNVINGGTPSLTSTQKLAAGIRLKPPKGVEVRMGPGAEKYWNGPPARDQETSQDANGNILDQQDSIFILVAVTVVAVCTGVACSVFVGRRDVILMLAVAGTIVLVLFPGGIVR
ncbi:hypothetical protein HDU76_001477 [Blyttiomyces sp. JEL0837]|nr:hypothetical protein HDU76_001477 [Blyttiomyces sp. JEL0837]